MNANFEHQARSPASNWLYFYADEIIERYAPSESPEEDKLALYHFTGCPFCSIVRSTIDSLGIDVEVRDIFDYPNIVMICNENASTPFYCGKIHSRRDHPQGCARVVVAACGLAGSDAPAHRSLGRVSRGSHRASRRQTQAHLGGRKLAQLTTAEVGRPHHGRGHRACCY